MGLLGQGINLGGLGATGISSFVASGSPYVHYKAESLSLSNNDRVPQWDDEIGTKNLVQATELKQPLYKTSGIGAYPTVQSQGSVAEGLKATFGETISQPNTIFMVFKVESNTATAGQRIWDSSGATRCIFEHNNSSGKFVGFAGSWIEMANRDLSPHYLTITYNGASSVFRLDGAASGAQGDPGANGMADIVLFSDQSIGTVLVNVSISELIIYNGTESPTDNEAMLAAKYGI